MRALLNDQSGVISRAQLVQCGFADHDIARLLRRRELTTLRRGVYISHTGPPTWEQHAWGALLMCQAKSGTHSTREDDRSAALRGHSSLVAAQGATSAADQHRLEVVVADHRRLNPPPDIDVRRSSATLSTVQWHLRPPRVRLEEAVVDVSTRHRRVSDMVAELSRVVGARRTTPQRLLTALEGHRRAPQRELLATVLRDLASGACSALEHGYLTQVERPHGLPSPQRQVRGRSRTAVVYRDAAYDALVLELDGRAWHDSVDQRDRDADRDLVAAVNGHTTVRLTWGQVFDRSCWTAAQVARLLDVRARRCGRTCTAFDH